MTRPASRRFDDRGNVPVAGGGRDAFVAAAAHPPAGAAAALFGQSLLLAAGDPAGRAWSAGAARGAETALTGSAATPVEFTVSCTAPSSPAAESIALAVGEFFLLPPDLRLTPPWASPDPRPAAERAQHTKARRTFLAASGRAPTAGPTGLPGCSLPPIRPGRRSRRGRRWEPFQPGARAPPSSPVPAMPGRRAGPFGWNR
jgi:hypothetical protein